MPILLSSNLLSKNLKIKIYRSIIFPVVLYGCENCSLILREKCGMKVFENWVLRIFGPKRDQLTREWRKLHNEELNNLYSSPNIFRVIKSRRMIWPGHIARMVERGVYKVLVGKPEVTDHSKEPGVDGRILLRWIFREWDVGHGLYRAGSG